MLDVPDNQMYKPHVPPLVPTVGHFMKCKLHENTDFSVIMISDQCILFDYEMGS